MKIKEQEIHKHGFVRLIDVMGDDSSIADAARVSYGEGTRSVSDNRNLIRYLVRHKHTSPLEMVEVPSQASYICYETAGETQNSSY